MRLLIVTQKVDKEDPVLGFFHNWIIALSKKFEKISVICLEKGVFDLPENVKVYSLGKESGKNKIKYIKNFFNLILGLHKEYDSVFVHMNQEYILLGGFIWKILRKKVYFWRNHQMGDIFTRIAVWFADKVFCTSKFAFVAKYKKTILMPVGIDTSVFNTELRIKNYELCKNKILFLGRMDKIKRLDLLVEALNILDKKRVDFVCDFYGDPTPDTGDYFESIKKEVEKSGLKSKINFYKAVPNFETPKIYNEHSIYVNLTPSGSFDKTILEAAACGCLLVVTNQSLAGEIDERMLINNKNPDNIAKTINYWLDVGIEKRKTTSDKLQKYVLENHSLSALIDKIVISLSTSL
ncbi:MAG: glycosyltransferase family 4 protein [Candidatus Paceibacterota bacterium]|jgi:glycosyltransferase involved in cell wall biosynthesis